MVGKVQIIRVATGEDLAVLPLAELERLRDAAEDAADIRGARAAEARIAAGKGEWIPHEVVKRLHSGENRIRVWREYRGFSSGALARAAKIAPSYLSLLESGKREGKVSTLGAIAKALRVSLDDLVE